MTNASIPINPRDCVKSSTTKIEVDLDKLDLSYQPEQEIQSWEPTKKLTAYSTKSKVYLDIETTGLDSRTNRVIMVGLKTHQGEVTIFDDEKEHILLEKIIEYITDKKPYLLIGHNLFNFDLPFLMTRCEKYGITHNFKFGDMDRNITSSSFNGQPIRFRPVNLPKTNIVDTFHQIAIWDKSANKLTSYNLKSSVIALGLRDEKRLELSNNQIQACYQNKDFETIKTYLEYDLDDTELLANYLIPVVYFQLKIVPNITLQELAIGSPALKAQKIHQSLIKEEHTADNKVSYEGGKVTLHKAGLHRDVAKIDVSSLYPSIMLRYQLCSRKDTDKLFLGVLKYMKDERIRLKQLAKEGNKQADIEQNALKILINGSYGYFGTGGYGFNDYEVAALITAIGRKILKVMEDFIVKNNGVLIESDTDGVIFSHNDPVTLVNNLSPELPSGIEVDLEYKNCVACVPKAKNYIILKPDGKVISKGVKRADIPLIKEFRVEYIKAWKNNPDDAKTYQRTVNSSLASGNYPIDKLTITRKIAKSEKNLVDLGIGQIGETVTYYYGLGNLATKTKVNKVPQEVTSGPYFAQLYIDKINELVDEMNPPPITSIQTSLFDV